MNHAEIIRTLAPLWLTFNETINSAAPGSQAADLLAARQQGIADAALALGCDQSFRAEVRRIVESTPRKPFHGRKLSALSRSARGEGRDEA